MDVLHHTFAGTHLQGCLRSSTLPSSHVELEQLSYSDIATEEAENGYMLSFSAEGSTDQLSAVLGLGEPCPMQQAAQDAAWQPRASGNWLGFICPDTNSYFELQARTAVSSEKAAAAAGTQTLGLGYPPCQPGPVCSPASNADCGSQGTAATTALTAATASASVEWTAADVFCSIESGCGLSSECGTASMLTAAAAAAAPAAAAEWAAAADPLCNPEPSCGLSSAPGPSATAAAAAAPAGGLRGDKRKETNRQYQRRLRQKRQQDADDTTQSLAHVTQKAAELQARHAALSSDHSALLGRLADATRKWQATVATNQQLHQANSSLQALLAEAQQQLAALQQECRQYRQLMQL